MNDHSGNVRSSTPQDGGGHPAPSGVAILAFFVIVGVAMVGAYFLLMKLIDMSRQEDCMLGGRRNCVAPIELPQR